MAILAAICGFAAAWMETDCERLEYRIFFSILAAAAFFFIAALP